MNGEVFTPKPEVAEKKSVATVIWLSICLLVACAVEIILWCNMLGGEGIMVLHLLVYTCIGGLFGAGLQEKNPRKKRWAVLLAILIFVLTAISVFLFFNVNGYLLERGYYRFRNWDWQGH